MNHIDILVLAIGLAMDCFAVSVCAGLAMSRIRWRPILTTAFLFGFFQGQSQLCRTGGVFVPTMDIINKRNNFVIPTDSA